jgi:hypothetical protein
MTDDAPLFQLSGATTYKPTVFTRGPWDPTMLHGGPVAALFAEVLQGMAPSESQPVRLTVDLVRPVPLAPLTMTTEVVRSGRRLQVVAGELRAVDKVVARATLALIAPAPFDASRYNPPSPPPPDGPDDDVDPEFRPPIGAESFVGGAMDFRFAPPVGLGHGVGWLRLRRAVLPGVAISPLARAAAAADVGNAVSSRRDPELARVSFVNADLSLSLSRPPEGEWIRLESFARWEPTGIGWVRSKMSDRVGEVGAVSNALVLDVAGPSFGSTTPPS